MPNQVCMGAMMMCSFGVAPSSLVVLPTNRVQTNMVPDANIMDHIPMVNIMPLEDRPGTYRLMVAIPVSTAIGSKGDVSFMRLIPGRYLITDVNGGPATVDRALAALKDFIRDHQRTVMAIPFQSLITNRMQEPDSSKWVTRIYYPVM